MAYNNYSFVIDSSFKPFSFQEMLAPFALYKDEYDKTQEAYHQLMDKAEDFSYLAKVADDDPDNGRSAQIYKGYANELKKYAQDLAHNGLSVGNKQGYLGLRNRYKGEIGRLENADKVLQEVLKSRRDEKDASMLYGTNNLTLDQFLDNQTPNMYKVSGNDLYAKGQAAGKAASSRVYSFGDMGSTLGGYYRMWGERNGYSADSINAFRANAAAIPELQQAADSILKETGVYDNLSGNNLERARQGVINGIIDGAVTNESVKPIEDKSKMSASAAASYALQREQMARNDALNGITWVNGKPVFNPADNIEVQKAAAVAAAKQSGKSSSGSGSGSSSNRITQSKDKIRISWKGSDPLANVNNEERYKKDSNNYEVNVIESDDTNRGKQVSYDDLPDYAKNMVDIKIGNGDVELYDYYFNDFKDGLFGGSKATLEIIPRDVKIYNGGNGDLDGFSGLWGASGEED